MFSRASVNLKLIKRGSTLATCRKEALGRVGFLNQVLWLYPQFTHISLVSITNEYGLIERGIAVKVLLRICLMNMPRGMVCAPSWLLRLGPKTWGNQYPQYLRLRRVQIQLPTVFRFRLGSSLAPSGNTREGSGIRDLEIYRLIWVKPKSYFHTAPARLTFSLRNPSTHLYLKLHFLAIQPL